MIEAFDKELPRDAESELYVLSAILFDSQKNIPRVSGIIIPEDFRTESHARIYRALLEMDADGDGIDSITLREKLLRTGQLERVGGRQAISQIEEFPIDPANIESYASNVKDRSRRRRALLAFANATNRVHAMENMTDIASTVASQMGELGITEDKASRGIYEVVRDTIFGNDERMKQGVMSGVETGFATLDETLQGIPRQALSILAAPSSHGKTTFAVNLAFNSVRARDESRVVVYSLEMSRQAIAERICARLSGVYLNKIRAWKLMTDIERAAVRAAQSDLERYNRRFFFADRISSVFDIMADCRARRADGGLDLAIVDYLQLVQGITDERMREREVNQIAWHLFQLAKDLKIAVLALSQITPGADNRKSGRMTIDDLRDSKAIGHHARVVMMLHRPWQANKTDWKNNPEEGLPCTTVLQVEKNSEGETGDLDFHFNGALQNFDEGKCDHVRCHYANRKGRT